MNNSPSQGTLYVVATPIGNLEDITPRAARILKEVDLIACEDTRHTRKLLSHLQISTALTSYYREKEQLKTPQLLKKLRAGLSIALVSDAGTPGVSDPGAVLVREARLNNITVEPIPGPSALTAAVSVAGLEENGFFFGGFPPAKQGERIRFFTGLARLPYPLVFYESPRRLKNCLKDCLDVFGNRSALLFKELTKLHEQSFAGRLSDIAEPLEDAQRGEFVLIIMPGKGSRDKPDNLPELLAWYKDKDMSLKDAVQAISGDLNLPRNQVYQEALKVWKPKR